MLQHNQKQNRMQPAEDAAWKELRGKHSVEVIASGEYVVPTLEAIVVKPGKQGKGAQPTLGDLEREKKRWLEYFIHGCRGEETKADRPQLRSPF